MSPLWILVLASVFVNAAEYKRVCYGIKQSNFIHCHEINYKLDNSLAPYMNKAKVIQLEFINCTIEILPQELFSYLPNLRHLNVSRCGMITISMVTQCRVTNVDASHNRIQEIGPNSFNGSYRLETIDLSYNIICSVHPDSFQDNIHLQRVDLSNNRIIRLQINIHSIQNLRFENNLINSDNTSIQLSLSNNTPKVNVSETVEAEPSISLIIIAGATIALIVTISIFGVIYILNRKKPATDANNTDKLLNHGQSTALLV